VLILPPGHSQTLAIRSRLSSRERWLIRGILAVVAALAVAVGVSLATSGHSTGNGCIDVNIPYSIGGQEVYRCGAAARRVCAAVGSPNGFTGSAGRAVAAECRKVSLPVGGGSA
jgi:hypothetical protein